MDNQATVTHTPGPWELPVIEGLTDLGDNYRHLTAGKGYYESETGRGFTLSGFMSDSDANLIVAAPDLLEAAQNLMFEMALVCGIGGESISKDNPKVVAMRAAIAKAEGRA